MALRSAHRRQQHVIVAGHGHGQLSTLHRSIIGLWPRAARRSIPMHGEDRTHAFFITLAAGALNEPETPAEARGPVESSANRSGARREFQRARRADHRVVRPEWRRQVHRCVCYTVLTLDAGVHSSTARACRPICSLLAARSVVLPHGAGVYGNLTAREYIAYFGEPHGLSREEAGARGRAHRDAGDAAVADRLAKGFSQAETQTALARALVHRPRSAAGRTHQWAGRDGGAQPAQAAGPARDAGHWCCSRATSCRKWIISGGSRGDQRRESGGRRRAGESAPRPRSASPKTPSWTDGRR